MGVWDIDENLNVEELTETLAQLNREYQEQTFNLKKYEELVSEYKSHTRDTTKKYSETKQSLQHAQHIAAGKCAKLLNSGERWHPQRTPCRFNAKPDSRFCGVHKPKGNQ